MSNKKIILIVVVGIVFLGTARIIAGMALNSYQDQKVEKNTRPLELTVAAIEGESGLTPGGSQMILKQIRNQEQFTRNKNWSSASTITMDHIRRKG